MGQPALALPTVRLREVLGDDGVDDLDVEPCQPEQQRLDVVVGNLHPVLVERIGAGLLGRQPDRTPNRLPELLAVGSHDQWGCQAVQ